VLKTRVLFFAELALALAMALAAVARTAILPSIGRNKGSLQDLCAFNIGISSIPYAPSIKRVTGVDFMLDRACWTLTAAAVLQDKHDDRTYFAVPAKLATIIIDVPSKRTGSPVYIREFTEENDYRFYRSWDSPR
jgi:hypothetical protein